jgi:hypothetical protein
MYAIASISVKQILNFITVQHFFKLKRQKFILISVTFKEVFKTNSETTVYCVVLYRFPFILFLISYIIYIIFGKKVNKF